ncbi:hypothetical protein DCMF_12515 [Candidatus Formimonas warabiya]|uniref:M23ase beta-sheet core domain-containing protein n=1 Tax=Formimonas warabiya TaxID=1761012 RepID=A0A3G1KSQ8_FORW1|nr:hypothetical protein DCMF_12515 [Candidatus Formimonas warabiya]
MPVKVKKNFGFTPIPSLHKRFKKRWVWQLVVSLWACAIIWGLIGTGSPLGEMVRNFVTSALSPQNDWMPAIQEVIHLQPENTGGNEQMVLPVSGIVVKNFGWDVSGNDQKKEWHGGIDIKAQKIQPVKAAAAGTVQDITGDGGQGYHITILHNPELSSIYGNLGRVLVHQGQQIKQGEPIGEAGQSQVYFEIRVKGTPVDPLNYLRSNRNGI